MSDARLASTQTETKSLSDEIKARGGTAVANTTDAWTMPTGSVLPIIQRSDVNEAHSHPRTAAATAGAVSTELSQITEAISNGSSAQTASGSVIFADVSTGEVMTYIKADTSSVAGEVRTWLENPCRETAPHIEHA